MRIQFPNSPQEGIIDGYKVYQCIVYLKLYPFEVNIDNFQILSNRGSPSKKKIFLADSSLRGGKGLSTWENIFFF